MEAIIYIESDREDIVKETIKKIKRYFKDEYVVKLTFFESPKEHWTKENN